MCIRDRRWARGERLVVRELLIALTTNVSIFDSECSLPLTIRKHKEWFFRPVQGRHYVLATLRNRKRQTQDSNPRFTAPTEIRRKHRPQMDASDDFVTLSQARSLRELSAADLPQQDFGGTVKFHLFGKCVNGPE